MGFGLVRPAECLDLQEQLALAAQLVVRQALLEPVAILAARALVVCLAARILGLAQPAGNLG